MYRNEKKLIWKSYDLLKYIRQHDYPLEVKC